MSPMSYSYIGTLPTEALISIFLLTAPVPVTFEDWSESKFKEPSNNRAFPGTLSAVSKAWRDVVVSTPSLWTSLRWKEGKHDPMLLALYVMRSKTLLLHLALSFTKRSQRPKDDSLVSPLVDRIVLLNLSRIAILHLTQPPNTWLNQFGRLTSTTAMSISWNPGSGPDAEVLLNKCRSLRRLSLYRGESNNHRRVFYKLPRSLQELHLTTLPLDTSVKLFLTSPRLVKFSIQHPTDPHRNLDDEVSQWWFSEPFAFEHLEELTWFRKDHNWARRLVSQASTPKLRRLCLIDPCSDDYPVPLMEEENQFFRRLPETLSTLELRGFWEAPELTNSLLFNCTSVENLILRGTGFGEIVDVFKGLTPTQGSQKCLPKLKNLSILDLAYKHLHELAPGHILPMVLMLEKRLEKGDVFCLTFSGFAVDWTPVIQRKLRSLRAKGVQLEIIEGSDAADWLESSI